MPQKSHDAQLTARDRMREQRERDRERDKRNRALAMGGLITAVLVVAGVVGVLIVGRQEDGAAAAAKPISQGRASAPSTLTVYEDFRCPACAHFERTFAKTIHQLVDQGRLKTDYHLVTLIDGRLNGKGSSYAANAAACARDAGKFTEYHDVLFANQPAESEDTFGDKKRLIKLAGEVDGLDTPEFRSCVNKGTHDNWVERSNNAFSTSGFNATPTVLLDGEDIYAAQGVPLTPQKLRQMVGKAAGAGS